MTEKKSASARLVRDDGLRRKLHMPDGREGIVLTQDGTGMVFTTRDQRFIGDLVREPGSGRLKFISDVHSDVQVIPVEEISGDKASA